VPRAIQPATANLLPKKQVTTGYGNLFKALIRNACNIARVFPGFCSQPTLHEFFRLRPAGMVGLFTMSKSY
jgi:hypothetical protein